MKFNKPTEININGFGGKQFQYVLTPNKENTINFKAQKPNGEKGIAFGVFL